MFVILTLLTGAMNVAARLTGSSYGLPAFDIFNSIASVIFDYIVIGVGTLAF